MPNLQRVGLMPIARNEKNIHQMINSAADGSVCIQENIRKGEAQPPMSLVLLLIITVHGWVGDNFGALKHNDVLFTKSFLFLLPDQTPMLKSHSYVTGDVWKRRKRASRRTLWIPPTTRPSSSTSRRTAWTTSACTSPSWTMTCT